MRLGSIHPEVNKFTRLVLVLVQIVLRTAATQALGPWLNEASQISGQLNPTRDLHFRSVSAAQFTGSIRPSPTLEEFASPTLHPMHGCFTYTPFIKLSETKTEFQDKHPQGYQATTTTTTTSSGFWWRLFGPVPSNITRNHSLNTYPSILTTIYSAQRTYPKFSTQVTRSICKQLRCVCRYLGSHSSGISDFLRIRPPVPYCELLRENRVPVWPQKQHLKHIMKYLPHCVAKMT